MKLTDNARQVAAEILDAFRSGTVPKALANTFLSRHHNCPSASWSWRNRLLVARNGHLDARGFRQWQEAGRSIRAGEHAFHILGPMRVKAKNRAEDLDLESEDEPGLRLIGFRAIPVFGYTQTEGEPIPALEEPLAYLDTLPLLEVAHAWGLVVKAVAPGDRLGYYRSGQEIGLAVENFATWGHEVVHAADDRLGSLTPGGGQKLDNEVVAELGGAILLECLGYTVESDPRRGLRLHRALLPGILARSAFGLQRAARPHLRHRRADPQHRGGAELSPGGCLNTELAGETGSSYA